MLLIEFNGLPGSGKTTVSHELIILLRNKGFIVNDLEDVRVAMRKVRVINICKYFGVISSLIGTIINTGRISKTKLRFAKELILTHVACSEHLQQVDIVVLEQGMLQDLLSIVYDGSYRSERFQKKLCKGILCDSKIFYVNTHIQVDIAQDRINARTHIGRLDREKDVAFQKKTLEKLNSNLQVLRISEINSVTISTDDAPYENAKMIIKNLGDSIS